MRKTMMAFGDLHIPHQNPVVLEIVKRVVRRVKPDILVLLGDMLDCGQFSIHPPTYGMPETQYGDDLQVALELLDYLQRYCGRLVYIEGNHEYRLDRWAASTSQGRAAYSELAPRLRLSKTSEANGDKERKKFTYVRYGSVDGRYPHYKINSRLVAVHGWSYAMHATKNHLRLSQGMSIIHGHTHRADVSIIQNVWKHGQVVQARSAGCMCQQIPMYGTGRPVEWIGAFILGYLGRRSDSLYTVPVLENRCVLPDGTQIELSTEECRNVSARRPGNTGSPDGQQHHAAAGGRGKDKRRAADGHRRRQRAGKDLAA